MTSTLSVTADKGKPTAPASHTQRPLRPMTGRCLRDVVAARSFLLLRRPRSGASRRCEVCDGDYGRSTLEVQNPEFLDGRATPRERARTETGFI